MGRRLAGAAAAALLVGCGGHAVHSVLDGVSAPDVARAAAAHLKGESYRFTATVDSRADTSAAVVSNPQLLDGFTRALDALGGLTIHGDLESPSRLSLAMSVRSATMTLVAYDGGAYGSADGHDFAELPSFESLLGSSTAASTPGDVTAFMLPQTATVQGRVDHNGIATEHISGDIDPAAFSRLLPQQGQAASAGAGLFNPAAAAGAAAAVTAMRVTGGHIDEYVSLSDGRPVAIDMSDTLSIDVAALLAALRTSLGPATAAELGSGQGSILMTGDIQQELSDYGAAIHIARPAPDLSQSQFVSAFETSVQGG